MTTAEPVTINEGALTRALAEATAALEEARAEGAAVIKGGKITSYIAFAAKYQCVPKEDGSLSFPKLEAAVAVAQRDVDRARFALKASDREAMKAELSPAIAEFVNNLPTLRAHSLDLAGFGVVFTSEGPLVTINERAQKVSTSNGQQRAVGPWDCSTFGDPPAKSREVVERYGDDADKARLAEEVAKGEKGNWANVLNRVVRRMGYINGGPRVLTHRPL